MRTCRQILLGFVLSGLLSPALLALEWPQLSAAAVAPPFVPQFVLTFAFRNPTAGAVQIRRIQTNCDCVEAATDKSSYAAGEAGLLTATFAVGERYGRYERTITVESSDSAAPTILTVTIECPEPAAPSPRAVEWAIGGAGGEQPVEIIPAEGLRIVFTDCLAINDLFRFRLETVAAGRHYRLHVQPRSTAAAANTAIRVLGHDAAGHQVVVSAYANVK